MPGKHKPFAVARMSLRNNRTGKTSRSIGKVKAFLDSGSSISLFPTRALAALQETGDFGEAKAIVQTANGVKEAVALKDVSLCLNEVCFRGDVAILDDIPGDVLIGTDFLKAKKCKIDFKKNTLICEGKKLPFHLEA
jgi:hypothetical protein